MISFWRMGSHRKKAQKCEIVSLCGLVIEKYWYWNFFHRISEYSMKAVVFFPTVYRKWGIGLCSSPSPRSLRLHKSLLAAYFSTHGQPLLSKQCIVARLAWISSDCFESFSPLATTEGVITTRSNRMKFRLVASYLLNVNLNLNMVLSATSTRDITPTLKE